MLKKLNLNLFILVTLFHRIRGDLVHIKGHEKIGSKPQLTQDLAEYLPETLITSDVSADDEKADEYKGEEIIVKNFNLNEMSGDATGSTAANLREKRVGDDVTLENELHCLSCFANGSSDDDKNCYKGHQVSIVKCEKQEKCYSEMHPDYVRRGCKQQSLLSRTHVCKCPLCNDKPFDDPSYYDYKNIRDWKYHNDNLELPLVGIDLFCTLCNPNETDTQNDKICKIGKDANYTMCQPNQLCYTNIDGQKNHVSRGCIDRPIYNSIYFFCLSSLCNNRTLHHAEPNPNSLRIFQITSKTIYLTSYNFIHSLAFLCLISVNSVLVV